MKNHINQALVSISFVIGAIAIAAIAFNYAGKVQLKIGVIQLQIEGDSKALQ
jgi:hypothetical protein